MTQNIQPGGGGGGGGLLRTALDYNTLALTRGNREKTSSEKSRFSLCSTFFLFTNVLLISARLWPMSADAGLLLLLFALSLLHPSSFSGLLEGLKQGLHLREPFPTAIKKRLF